MIVPDINLLLYAYDTTSPFHLKASSWWEGCVSGNEPVGLPLVVAFGFIRVGTNARVFRRPMSIAVASEHIRSWLASPALHLLSGGSDHIEHVLRLLTAVGGGANLVTDAQIAAIAIEHGAVVHTSDSDFVRFPELRWFNPITGIGTHSLRRSRRTE